ncbi:dystrophin-related protein 2-like [Stegodyphus dumicola]|uniref:dystrophin-related protein 2-like n=1 Tax=Stegodyphus dumicola TaxID=202533 RepID=UPI0015ABF904|nr:dystrophin-related protein 2-like [Stegodyphus dumicola]
MISCFKGGTSNFWRKSYENTQGALYTSSTISTDDMPRISKIIESLKQYDVFKYSAYRTAFKLRTIQKASKLHMVDLSVIGSILKDYECSNQSIEEPITPSKAENLLCALYTEASKKIGFTEEPNLMALLFLAFLQNTFVEAEKPLLFIHVKIALTLFSAAKLSGENKYLFYHCSGGTSISKENLELLLKSLSKMAEIVGEQVTFGSHLVPAAVKHCLKFCKGRITEKKFNKWLSLEPQTTVWISTLHRISASEKIQHTVTCSHCQVNPIIGLRYRCLQCINYNLCQNCFLCGQRNQGHKERHPVQEFCLPASVWEETKATMNAIKNKIPFARCPARPYLSFDDESLYESFRDPSKNISVKTVQNRSMKMTTNADLIIELSSIINKLEEEKKQISAVVGLYNEKHAAECRAEV